MPLRNDVERERVRERKRLESLTCINMKSVESPKWSIIYIHHAKKSQQRVSPRRREEYTENSAVINVCPVLWIEISRNHFHLTWYDQHVWTGSDTSQKVLRMQQLQLRSGWWKRSTFRLKRVCMAGSGWFVHCRWCLVTSMPSNDVTTPPSLEVKRGWNNGNARHVRTACRIGQWESALYGLEIRVLSRCLTCLGNLILLLY